MANADAADAVEEALLSLPPNRRHISFRFTVEFSIKMSSQTADHAEGAREVDTAGLSKRLESKRDILQARSLANVLVVLRRRLGELDKAPHTHEDLQHFRKVLDDIDARWRDAEGTFAGRLASADPKTASLCSRLFNECYDLLEGMQHTAAEMPAELKDVHRRLVALEVQLARMQADPDHTLAEVLPLQQQLDEIDAERLSKGGSFASGTDDGLPGEHVCGEALNHCYELLAGCVRSAEDISPEMKDVYDRLRAAKNALRKLMGKRHHTVEDLQHWQGVLEGIDAERVDGVFCGNLEEGIVPHGQAAASKLLDDCYDLIEKLTDTAENMPPDMRTIFVQLEQHRHDLEGMLRRQRTLAEVKAMQEKLDAIDDERQAHAGIFAQRASEQGRAPPGQAVCSALLNHNYRMLHDLYADLAALEAAEQ
ncbi:hypothetical protein ABPG77_001789 [Micractinium sp. CCAP 211/92]